MRCASRALAVLTVTCLVFFDNVHLAAGLQKSAITVAKDKNVARINGVAGKIDGVRDSAAARGPPSGGEKKGGHGDDDDPHAGVSSTVPTAVATAVSIMLLGMMTFQVSTFYMVKYPDLDVQRFTWSCLSQTVSIFCAILIYTGLKDLMLLPFMGVKQSHDELVSSMLLARLQDFSIHRLTWLSEAHLGGGGHEISIPCAAYVFFMLFFLVQGTFIALRERHVHMEAFASVSGHVLGFAGIEVFGGIQQKHPWCNNAFGAIICVILSCLVIYVLCHAATKLRRLIDDTEEGEHWREECCEAEDELGGFVLGLLMSAVVRFMITGSLPPVHGNPFGKTPYDVWMLFLAACIFGVLVMYSTVATKNWKEDYANNPTITRACDVLQECVSMCFGWCFLFWSRWLFWCYTNDEGIGNGELVTARVVQALGITVFVYAAIFAVDWFSDKADLDFEATKALQNSFGLLLGLSWEGAFGEAILSIGRNYSSDLTVLIVHNVVGFAICIMVIPAWVLHIMPDATRFKKLYAKPAGSHGVSPVTPGAQQRSWRLAKRRETPTLEQPH
eukprot:TRINITY_DN71459_c0_g1_i1.p1 TRINITY_DN71459_c0_g1~~TRINITY_DN71459_c0_g1_i1.p1  ORF type:complete len:578 (-),score=99.09 TRINITY_DN71459_c0_g1_i1:64-1737(-)